MRVYIIQHAQAIPKDQNPPVRILTDKGIEDTRRLATILNGEGVTVDRFMHVGTAWTQDNAEKLANFMESNSPVVQTSYPLLGKNNIDDFIDELGKTSDNIAISTPADVAMRSVTRLLTGKEEPWIPVKSEGLCSCLERGEDGSWNLLWMLRSEHLLA